ncbi:hypothetical protein GTO10_05405 [Candidatus Saccharibacteria bacterium]|nr:hypothetical protein [Candidatus Saccharibacteria bacterium]
MLKKLLRRTLRFALLLLSRWVIRKHEPTVIAILGNGQTATAREATYHVLKHHFPTRRNLETPDAEFVLPLTVLGTRSYPKTYAEWLLILLKSATQLLILPKHKNFLVLEIGYTRAETFDYFWKITQPQVAVVCGDAPYLSKEYKAPKTVRVKEAKGLRGYFDAAVRVGKLFGIPPKAAKDALANFTLPKARIRILPAKEGGIIIDATHEYLPPKKEALDEVLENFAGKKIVVSEKSIAKAPRRVKAGEVVVLIGPSKKLWPVLLELSDRLWT